MLSVIMVLGILCSSLLGNQMKVSAASLENVNEYNGYRVEVAETLPENVIPKEFDTWEEAKIWINNLRAASDSRQIMTLASPGALDDGFLLTGDLGGAMYERIPSGTGTCKRFYDYEVGGLSAQTIESSHYFEYSNKKVTKCTSSANISGFGLCTWRTTYSELEKYGNGSTYNYYSVLKGDLGYFITVGGVNVGLYEEIELTYCLYNFI